MEETPDMEVDIEGELERIQGVCERIAKKMEKEGNKDSAFYHKVLGQHIEQAVRYTKGR